MYHADGGVRRARGSADEELPLNVAKVVIQLMHVGAEVAELALTGVPRFAAGALLHFKSSRDVIFVCSVEVLALSREGVRLACVDVSSSSGRG